MHGERAEKKENHGALVITVDFNNFLPCLSVAESDSGEAKIEYRPLV